MSLAVTGSETHVSTSVPTADCLCSLDTAALAPGELAYVQDTKQFYFFDPESAAAADGVSVVCAPNDCGRWILACINCVAPTGATGTNGAGEEIFYDEITTDVDNTTLALATLLSRTVTVGAGGAFLEIHFDASGFMTPAIDNACETRFAMAVDGNPVKGAAYCFEPLATGITDTGNNSAAITHYMFVAPGSHTVLVAWQGVTGDAHLHAASAPDRNHASLLIEVHPA